MKPHTHEDVRELDGQPGEFLDHLAEMHGFADEDADLKRSRTKHQQDHQTTWCEHCRDSYAGEHFDAEGSHLIGAEYGPTGETMQRERALSALLDAVEPLMDPDYCAPYRSAWELDTHGGRDGEVLHEALRAAYLALRPEGTVEGTTVVATDGAGVRHVVRRHP